jgi:hypothetical protein
MHVIGTRLFPRPRKGQCAHDLIVGLLAVDPAATLIPHRLPANVRIYPRVPLSNSSNRQSEFQLGLMQPTPAGPTWEVSTGYGAMRVAYG